jgi:hypothetical protein
MNLLKKLASFAKSPVLWQAVTALVAVLALVVAYLAYRLADDTDKEQKQAAERQKRTEIERVASRVVLSGTGDGAGCTQTLCAVVENRSIQDVFGVAIRIDDADPNTLHDGPAGYPIGDIPACKSVVVVTDRDVASGLYGLSLEFYDGERYWRKKSPLAMDQSPRLLEVVDPDSLLSLGPSGRVEVGRSGVLSISGITPCD